MGKKKAKRGEKPYHPEQLAAANELNIDPENDTVLMKLAHDMCRPESMPTNWEGFLDAEKNRRYYHNSVTGVTTWEHPLIGYYRGAIFMERGGYEELLTRDEAEPPTEEEISEMMNYFGVKSQEDPYIQEIARIAVSAPLPEGWEEVVTPEGDLAFKQSDTGEVSAKHPLDEYFLELRNRRRKEIRKRKKLKNVSAAVNAFGHSGQQQKEAEVEEEEEEPKIGIKPRPNKAERVSIAVVPKPSQERKSSILQAVRRPSQARKVSIAKKPPTQPTAQPNPNPVVVEEIKTGANDAKTHNDAPRDSPLDDSAAYDPRPDTKILLRFRPGGERDTPVWRIDPQGASTQISNAPDELRDYVQKSENGPLDFHQSYRFDGVVDAGEPTSDLFAKHLKEPVESVATREASGMLILGFGHSGTGKSHTLFGDEQNDEQGLAELVLQAAQHPSSSGKNVPKVTGVKASMLQISGHEVRDLLKGKSIQGIIANIRGNGELDFKALGVHEESVKNQKSLISALHKGFQHSTSGHTLLNFKLEFGKPAKGETGWIHILKVSASGNRPTDGDSSSWYSTNGGCCDSDMLLAGALFTKFLKGSTEHFLPQNDSLLAQIIHRIGSKEGKLGVVATADPAQEHAIQSYRTVSLGARVGRAMENMRKEIVEARNPEAASYIAHVEVLRTVVQSLKDSNASGEAQLKDYWGKTNDLCQRLEKICANPNLAGDLLNSNNPLVRGEVPGNDMLKKDLETKFKNVLDLLNRAFLSRNSDEGKLKAYEKQVTELQDTLQRYKSQSMDLSQKLEDNRDLSNGKASEIADYENQMKDMKHKIDTLENKRMQHDQRVATYEKEIDELRREVERLREISHNVGKYESDISRLTKHLEEARSSESGRLAEVERLKAQRDDFASQLQTLKAKEAESRTIVHQLRTQLEGSSANLNDTEDEAIRLKNEVESLSKALGQFREQERERAAQLRQSQELVEELKGQVESFSSSSQKHREFAEKYKTEIADLRKELDELKKKEELLNSEMADGKLLQEKIDAMSEKTGVLQKEKAILLDRLENVTGAPQGDIHDDMPPPPPGVSVPSVEVKKGTKVTPEMALSSIMRIVRLARPQTCENSNANSNRATTPEAGPVDPGQAVVMVRELRSERNEMRRRDRVWRDENAQLRKKLKMVDEAARHSTVEDIDSLASSLEQILGVSAPHHNLSPVQRLRVGVQAASLMNEEIMSLQRQHASLGLLLRQEERKVSDKDKEIKISKKREAAALGGRDVQPCCSCEERKDRLEEERDDLKDELKEWTSFAGKHGNEAVGSAALREAHNAKVELHAVERRLRAVENDRDKWKRLHELKPKGEDAEKVAYLASGLFKWKSAPLPKQQSALDSGLSQKKRLPSLGALKTSRSGVKIDGGDQLFIKTKAGFDTRPVPVEVKKKVQRMEDRIMREPSVSKGDELKSSAPSRAIGDPRDAEIADLKVRLVRAEKERADVASRAAVEKREAHVKLQHATRVLEQAQLLTEQLMNVMSASGDGEECDSLLAHASQVVENLLKRTERMQSL